MNQSMNSLPLLSKPQMLTVSQAAKTKILPERTLRRLVADGTIPSVKSGKTAYINFDLLTRRLAENGTI
jgi:excisionase family DNA binding protein